PRDDPLLRGRRVHRHPHAERKLRRGARAARARVRLLHRRRDHDLGAAADLAGEGRAARLRLSGRDARGLGRLLPGQRHAGVDAVDREVLAGDLRAARLPKLDRLRHRPRVGRRLAAADHRRPRDADRAPGLPRRGAAREEAREAEAVRMKDWFAGDVAARYDTSTAGMPVEPVVDFLEPLAGGGALELAIGTGRIAVPLAERGVRVAGIDLSPDMVAELRKKTDEIPVAIGDMSTTRVEGTFSLVYIVFNSINNVTSQDGQVAVFANAAAHL